MNLELDIRLVHSAVRLNFHIWFIVTFYNLKMITFGHLKPEQGFEMITRIWLAESSNQSEVNSHCSIVNGVFDIQKYSLFIL